MIFVTVGGDTHSFSRLLGGLKKLIIQGEVKDEVIIQSGNTKCLIDGYQCFDFVDIDKFEQLVEQSDLIIGHAGGGTVATALKFNKPLIVMPRLKKFKEHVDDHQLELAEALAKQGRIISLYRIGQLKEAIDKVAEFKSKNFSNKKHEIVKTIEDYCQDI